MAKIKKLSTQLTVTDLGQKDYKNGVLNYSRFFKNSQGAFRGEKKTYQAKDGALDVPGKRGVTLIQTTVKEKFDYFISSADTFIEALFSQEKTNSMNIAKAELVVDGKSWGEFSSLELLRLKTLLEDGQFGEMLENIPVRSDAEIWTPATDEAYQREGVFESPLIKTVEKTTTKQHFILEDPNINNPNFRGNYTPVQATRDIHEEVGEGTFQKFSGEYTQRAKAEILQRRSQLIIAVTEALKIANDVKAETSELTSQKIFGHIFYGL